MGPLRHLGRLSCAPMATGVARRAGRPRGFDLPKALDGAVDVFWELGYEATTTRDLERRLSISQSSLYNTFGSKKNLLLAAIDRYEERIRGELFCLLTDSGGGIAAVESFVGALGSWIVDNEHRGCLVVNLMTAAADDDEIAQRASAYRDTIRQALYAALRAEPGTTKKVAEARSQYVLAAVLGLHVTARSSADPAESAAMVDAMCVQVKSWT